MSATQALIVIGRSKEEWNRLPATPGAFIEIWETTGAGSIENAVKNFEALGDARYVDACWLIGERANAERA